MVWRGGEKFFFLCGELGVNDCWILTLWWLAALKWRITHWNLILKMEYMIIINGFKEVDESNIDKEMTNSHGKHLVTTRNDSILGKKRVNIINLFFLAASLKEVINNLRQVRQEMVAKMDLNGDWMNAIDSVGFMSLVQKYEAAALPNIELSKTQFIKLP